MSTINLSPRAGYALELFRLCSMDAEDQNSPDGDQIYDRMGVWWDRLSPDDMVAVRRLSSILNELERAGYKIQVIEPEGSK